MKVKIATTGVAALIAASLAAPVGAALATTGGAYPSCVGGRCSPAATKATPATSANDATVARSSAEMALIRHHALGRLGPPLPGTSHANAPIHQPPPAVAGGFDWGPVAIGAVAAVGLIGIAGASVALRRRRSVAVQPASRG
jgi:hypothetical protein